MIISHISSLISHLSSQFIKNAYFCFIFNKTKKASFINESNHYVLRLTYKKRHDSHIF